MDTNKMREQFLAWLDPAWNRGSFIDDDGDEVFTDHWVQGAWVGWVASRDAVVVELPKDIVTMAGPVLYADDVRAAIAAQGLKVEVKP